MTGCVPSDNSRAIRVGASTGTGTPAARPAVPAPPRRVRREWAALAAPTVAPARFDPHMTDGLPSPVRRWLAHAVAPGAPLLQTVVLVTHGEIRMGTWRRFRAHQVLAPPRGLVWVAGSRLGGLPVSGFDRYSGGTGEMRWRLLRAVPVMSGSGPDITRSAAGRLACEFPLVPPVALGPAVCWEPVDDRQAVAHVRIGQEEFAVTMRVSPSGRLESVAMLRWGNPDRHGYGEHPFGAVFEGESHFGGFTLPRTVRAGWWFGTERWREGEFIRFALDEAAHH
ncbi:DUF6544 family protein [Streptomyces telluris]|uniref:Uncharacterized protein n=1 Tax=Streptomyces telluris TaxID=2720021 RepID=A0A9X2LII4_9ACTN|nr:DUF6544 family protein [Streptomyces telluris]MCQ8770555.1 hypothetical protein [Streptomyces telluris]NJP81458.1 hypothetical protein [Streptomyces telluris]